MNPQHHLYNIDEYFDINTDLITYKKQILPLESNKKKYYITLKIYYNYFKSLINYNSGKLYKQYSNSFDWDELTIDAKNKIITNVVPLTQLVSISRPRICRRVIIKNQIRLISMANAKFQPLKL